MLKCEDDVRKSKFNKLDKLLLTNPLLTTTFSAFLLALLWTIVWFLVLLFVTYTTQSSTVADVLVGGLVLSTVAEAIIRIFENSRLVQMYAKGTLIPIKSDRTLSWALSFVFGGMIILIFIKDFIHLPDEPEFNLASPENGGIEAMLPEWIEQFSNSPVMVIGLLICLVVRTILYKQSHKTKAWKKTIKYVTMKTAVKN